MAVGPKAWSRAVTSFAAMLLFVACDGASPPANRPNHFNAGLDKHYQGLRGQQH